MGEVIVGGCNSSCSKLIICDDDFAGERAERVTRELMDELAGVRVTVEYFREENSRITGIKPGSLCESSDQCPLGIDMISRAVEIIGQPK